VTNEAIAHARLRNSRLAGAEPCAAAVDVVRWFGAVQSQDVPGALWALAQRMAPGTTMADVGADFDDGRIVRTHAMRPTWHFVAPDELRWIQALTAERVHRVSAGPYRRLHLSDDSFARAEAVMRRALGGGRPQTRDELARAIAAGTSIDVSDPLVPTFLAMHAELEALISSGPRRGKQFTYLLTDDRLPADT